MNNEAILAVHESKINALESNVEKISESALATVKNMAETTQISKHCTHELKSLRAHYEDHEKRIRAIENQTSNETSFQKGRSVEKASSKNNVNYLLGIIAGLATIVATILAVHEFASKNTTPHHLQQTVIKSS